ncbi:hypothetical protein RJ639_044381 [Escallonia herrerae]|uniref:Uncharacterized protein n=1 Tax=Escallonia herrerae TaxID=1293975 RepID=A0AA89B2X9_9ASTE|nr:hypothetical protein RJ639_044381 [Escallonia herrerae]
MLVYPVAAPKTPVAISLDFKATVTTLAVGNGISCAAGKVEANADYDEIPNKAADSGITSRLLGLSKFIIHYGLHVTFVNTQFNHKHFLKAWGPNSFVGLSDFCFKTIPDKIPLSDVGATQDMIALSESVRRICYAPFLDLCNKHDNPPVSSIVSDGFMTFMSDAAEVLGIPIILFWTLSAAGFMGFC